tara:strand:- start:22900 stop:23481 length:582 start_codon:yes stop_codon:yes gene_type:complete
VSIQRIWREKRFAIIVLIGMGVVDAGLLVLGVLPLNRRLGSSGEEIELALRERVEQERNLEESKKRNLFAKNAREDLDVFYETLLPSNVKVARAALYRGISNHASSERLVLERRLIQREEGESDLSPLSRLEATIRLSGLYSEIRRFIDKLETADDFIVIDNLTLGSRAGIDENTLVLTMRLSTYFIETEIES